MIDLKTSPEELFALIGEREFIKFKYEKEIARLNQQIWEMSEEIKKLRGENGGLEQPPVNH